MAGRCSLPRISTCFCRKTPDFTLYSVISKGQTNSQSSFYLDSTCTFQAMGLQCFHVIFQRRPL